MPKWAVCITTESSLWPEAGYVLLQLSSALGVPYLMLLGNPVEFLPSFHLKWTFKCSNYKINPHTFIEPKYEEKIHEQNGVCVLRYVSIKVLKVPWEWKSLLGNFFLTDDYKSKYTLNILLSKNLVDFAWTRKSVYINSIENRGLQTPCQKRGPPPSLKTCSKGPFIV